MEPFWILLPLLLALARSELVRDLEVSEGAPVGTRIGFIEEGVTTDSGPPYLVVPVGNSVNTDLLIDLTTGEISTKVLLDRETRSSYSLVAITISGYNIQVHIKVLDENDNAPTFPVGVMTIDFPENTPLDVKRTLHPAKDLDLDQYNTQRYNIVSGNVNNAFRLSAHRERDSVLYLDLQINGFLDRESIASYSLLIEALDGGTPPLRGEMMVNITIQDVNDNQPIFNQSRYFATIPENATVGTTVLQVFATDTDSNENGKVEYSINRRQSDKDVMFRIDSTTGFISVNKPLDFETKELHELVIVARDRGLQPLETTAFVSIKVTDVNDNQPTITVIFLSDDATPKISESAQPGEFVARISVNDPDSKTEYSNINVTLDGGEGHFGLTTRDNIIYLVIVSLPLDREIQPNYTLNVVATDTGTPPLHASRTILLKVTDINDNAPEFEKDVYQANVMEISDPGTSVIQVSATDKDEGNNSAITYSLAETSDTHYSWFQIDPRSGLVTTKVHVDCETDPVPKLTVIATDNGFPPLSSSATVHVTIHDVNDNEPIFDQSFYNVSVAENIAEGKCILKVSATDPDCGVNAMVNYTLGDGFGKLKEFEVKSGSGEVCITSSLDYETRNVYEFPVIATDRGGLSTTAMIKIQITDVNDNRPNFYPREYNVSLREGDTSSNSPKTPVVIVAATDADSGKFGQLTYGIVAGNGAGLFKIDKNTGEISINRPNLLSTRTQRYHRLNISATDGGGLQSSSDAEVFISVIDATQRPPIFEHPRYTYSVKEDVRRDTIVGSVKASVTEIGGRQPIRYSIYSGDPDGYFRIDAVTGAIRTASTLDHETRSSVLLNIQVKTGDPPIYGHTQVNIEIQDVNDNAPEFESNTVRISVPENVEIGVPLYAAHARDRDSGPNGVVKYRIANKAASGGIFDVDAKLGHLTLTRNLDYETVHRHSLIITATDTGVPQLSANLTVSVEVQDVNDNPPIFERNEYSAKILETLPINSQILQVTATDSDTGNNARLTYRITSNSTKTTTNNNNVNNDSDVFGIFPNSGWIYLKGTLDRETKDLYNLTIAATDNGTPSESALTRVIIKILDANDNDPVFSKESYEFIVEENLRRGTVVGSVSAKDLDVGPNGSIKYSIIPSNASFQINPISGELVTKEILDRELKEVHDLVIEARDQGSPSRSTRVSVKIFVSDVNDNDPEIIDPQEDVVSVREEQPPGTEVVKIKAIDIDNGNNSTVSYSILKRRDSDGYGVFSIDPVNGVIRTRMILDHEDKTIYRLSVAATDNGNPQRQTIRTLRVEVLDLNDNRPTFTSSSLVFRVREDVPIGFIVGSVATSDQDQENVITGSSGGHITYTLNSLMPESVNNAFDIDRNTGSLVVARKLDREFFAEYRFEVRALDTSAMNNPQSSAVTVRVDVADVNDNAPIWGEDPITIQLSEDTEVGSVIYNFTATDADSGSNGDLRYTILKNSPNVFSLDFLTGTLVLASPLDFETLQEYTIIIKATDQSLNVSERLSTSATVRILITDSNDNVPKFVIPPTNTIFFSDSMTVGMLVSRIVAVDSDSGDNGRVTYVISGGNEGNTFALGYDTGIITLARTVNANDKKLFLLNITASDHGSPTRHAYLTLKLACQSSTENPPRFINSLYYANIQENVQINTFVIKVAARSPQQDDEGNLTFSIPNGIADDAFTIHPINGIVKTQKILDRELKDSYEIPIYVTSNLGSSKFDLATLHVTVTDSNDHAPEFTPGSCYGLYIPENADYSIIHTIIASDKDTGNNGEIIYSISSGNIGNKFSIDPRTGELSAKPLDRETHPKYNLTISAQDKGNPPLQSYCNITVHVGDQNDNDPKFDLPNYFASIIENVPVYTSVMKVHASDPDLGINRQIIYSLANESQWLFRIDNKTGVITTAGLFDRELKSSYQFYVVATDGGKYNSRFQKVPVTVTILDANDNKPIFTKYPFKEKVVAYIQPGHTILQVSAKDIDQGTNSDIVYSLSPSSYHSNKFRINPNTGILSASQSLGSENGKVIHLNVIATDKGNPPQSSTGLIEISIGETNDHSPKLRFQNATYRINLPENLDNYQEVIQVIAVRNDGRKQKISYSFGAGNEDNIFIINAETGQIQIKDNRLLDYEIKKEINLVIEAKTDSNPILHSYCNVIVQITDQNDNTPKFSQQQYSASLFEGNNKSELVLQVFAFDADEGQNARILYHIVDGNHDNAFKIEPAFSGILRTNIVLDREIRDIYRLTVIATDEGVPQMTGTTRVHIKVVDINDNQPTFPPHSIITVSEATNVGTVLTSVTANDVDTNPPLVYSFAADNDKESLKNFSIDRYNGKVILKKKLDFENQQEYNLRISASDSAHIAYSTLTIRVTDINDNPPVFTQNAYYATLPDGHSTNLIDLISVNASDMDTGENAKIKYSIVNQIQGFLIDDYSGTIRVNQSNISVPIHDYQLTVKAEDLGTPSLHSLAAVRVKVNSGGGQPRQKDKDYKVQIPEDTPKGTKILHLPHSGQNKISYLIIEGNDDGVFEIANPSGVIILVKTLDREHKDFYNLKLSTGVGYSSNYSMISVQVSVDDTNDNAPVFEQEDYEYTIKEDVAVGTTISVISAKDNDQANTLHSEILYDITSGNDLGLYRIDDSGDFLVNNTLDYDNGLNVHNLVIRACDKAPNPLCTLATLQIILEDSNDNEPKFPVQEYLEFVAENEAVGTAVFTAQATDLDKGVFGFLNYSIVSSTNHQVYTNNDDASKLFHIDALSGVVVTNAVFDYEQRNRYVFIVKASDVGGKSAFVKVRIEIESKDEFHPQFTERTYKFGLGSSIKFGDIVGHVTATDRDKGPDGRVVYQLTTQNPYFKINRTTGAVIIKKKFDNAELFSSRDVSLVITASSGRQGSLTNMTVVEISIDPLNDISTNLAINNKDGKTVQNSSGIADWALGLLISLILLLITFGAVFVFLHMRNKKNKKVNKPNLGSEAVSTSNNYVDPSAFDTIPIRNTPGLSNNQFAPPKYDEIPPYGGGHAASSNSGAATTSELSGSEQSGSSGRGSAEEGDDGEDEEIRMINEGPLQRDSGIHRQNDDEDNLSDVSVRNTQEYLARLGIVNNGSAAQTATRLCGDPRPGNSHQSVPLDSLHMFDEDGNAENISNFYAKLNDVAGSDRASSSDENSNANNLTTAMDHVMAIGYGDVPTVTHQPSMNGSLSSIVHSEEELAGSYNWDYLLDWGPQYQPLAHVFSEIARLKDDTASVQSATSGNSSVKSKNSIVPAKNIPPPLITSVAPRSVINSRAGPSHHNPNHNQIIILPRSPISHDASGATFSTSAAMSPSFSPSLSPLATKSPSISPLVTPGLSTAHHMIPRQPPQSRSKTVVDTELRL
nr:protein dachsous isoform X1 [Onthophagus taurus]